MNNYDKFEAMKKLDSKLKAAELLSEFLDELLEETKRMKYYDDGFLSVMFVKENIDSEQLDNLIELINSELLNLEQISKDTTIKFESL